MSSPPRLVATDIDGTLVRSDRTISARTISVLERVSASGVPVVLVTGRPIRWLNQVYDQLGALLPAVCANGAVIYDPDTDTPLHTAPMDPEMLSRIAERLRAEIPGIVLAVEIEDSRHMLHEEEWPVRWESGLPTIRVAGSPEEITSAPAVKLLARSGSRDADEFAALVNGCLTGLAEATHSSYSGLVEISAVGVTKAAGLEWYCRRHGVDAADVIAFGDMPNDLPMLTWVGRPVAMANGHPAVLEIAADTTLSNDEDGVAAYLEKVFRL
ncbi:HAD family hydrolase [Catenuloplanes indicus]|uniref:Cof subfamily protein (Haloacid dehalogenase superfamily) n=1 Tax=Catenuloplanes indicus TaxID=137267 RepID=A0AAE4AYT7_9ACTN|nr:HAD family hydrolase [Catenuloplanes indicus]MDQ0367684.1 Cof subfamily protein (haloacid dehalogenase superfamily) [Catenuloplanes indicus]